MNAPMNTRSITRVILLALLAQSAASSYASAQTIIPPQKRRGIASSLAMGFVDDRNTDEIWISPPGSIGAAQASSQLTFSSQVPNYGAAFSDFPGIEIDALSTGNDFIGSVTAAGSQPTIGGADLENPPRWQAFAVTLESGATPAGTASILPMLPQTQGSIISYYMRGSSAPIPVGYRDTTHAEQLPPNIWGQASVPSPVPTILAQDFALGALAYAAGPAPQPIPQSIVFMHGAGDIYFSVTRAYAQAYGTQQGAAITSWDPAAVYVRKWDTAAAPLAWSTPVEEISSSSLGLDNDTDDLDALAYDWVNQVAVYSTQPGPDRSQLCLWAPGAGVPGTGGLVPYWAIDTSSGQTVQIGSLMDKLTVDEESNVTSACSIDPGFEAQSVRDHILGLPVDPAGGNGTLEALGFSMCRSDWTFVTLQATGIGDIPDDQSSLVVGFLEYYNGASWAILPGTYQVQNPATRVCEWRLDVSSLISSPPVPYTLRAGAASWPDLSWTSSNACELYVP